jgi:hypothetical protein
MLPEQRTHDQKEDTKSEHPMRITSMEHSFLKQYQTYETQHPFDHPDYNELTDEHLKQINRI